ncbi:50S ribosomal protein L25/general stress protein Ctc [Draconibacterium sp. IB214405]|uniref:50S ribosomal protein L25/general stress protein Ctc n=1 Tax=Draconibacterium sp. IB214405 TaxID=3097352 RepID=UPI002A18054B|nr:50S ribosomal protein L25/general stress protein Ctc [Draconibacterium sp. IB214405]MDX8341017.1 50S ribosomal protein L25/general stress protein Ctc [Draconibacterium sp. IB214405]
MKSVVVKGELRSSLGKKDSKKLRAEEKAPAVLYGGDQPIHFAVPFSELRQLVYTPSVYLIDLDIDGTVYKAIMQDIQWHPVEELVLHVDFLAISEDKPVKIAVPVKIQGYAKGLRKGGKLNTNLRRLTVKALANALPDTIDIDVSNLDLAQSIKVGDLTIDGIDLLDQKSNVIVSVAITRAARSAAGAATDDEEEEESTEAAEE